MSVALPLNPTRNTPEQIGFWRIPKMNLSSLGAARRPAPRYFCCQNCARPRFAPTPRVPETQPETPETIGFWRIPKVGPTLAWRRSPAGPGASAFLSSELRPAALRSDTSRRYAPTFTARRSRLTRLSACVGPTRNLGVWRLVRVGPEFPGEDGAPAPIQQQLAEDCLEVMPG
jgi:hypothetical protein